MHSPLHEKHLARGAKMADFGGWLMPIEYPGVGTLAEHAAVRERVGLFDVSHLGKARVRGAGALDFLNRQFTNDLTKIGDGSAQYTLYCDPNGGVIDDLIVYRLSDEELFLVPNAANTAEVVGQLVSAAPSGVTIENLHNSYAVIALQGPLASAVLKSLGIESALEYMAFTEITIAGVQAILCRTGYTGELGFEILPPWQSATEVWDVLAHEVEKRSGAICGLGARDTLRTEMGYPLHGHELTLQISPVQAAASWAIAWEKEFVGKDALLRQKSDSATPRLRGIKSVDRGIPRAGMKVLRDGAVIGEITSGTFSPTRKCGIGLALLPRSISVGDRLMIDVRGRLSECEVVTLPFVPSHVR